MSWVVKKLSNKKTLMLLLLLSLTVFTRFYQLEERAVFDWDQINNAWQALRIINEQKYPLMGMIAKANSGIYIGPLYYYFASVFYFLTNLDPIASPIIAGVTSIFSFFVLYFVTKKLFGLKVALFSCFIYSVSNFIIQTDRVQWPVNFIPAISFLIFYFLYKVITGHPKNILWLTLLIGVSFHIHLTSIFFPFIILFSLPFFPRSKETLKYILFSIPVLLVFLIPFFIFYSNPGNLSGNSNYLNTSFHGFHLVRLFQLSHDAFIQFESIITFRFFRNFVFLFFPAFAFVYYSREKIRRTHNLKLFYLITLWILVPWVILTTFKGELSNYYFFLPTFLVINIYAYLSVILLTHKRIFAKVFIILFWVYYSYINLNNFFNIGEGTLKINRDVVRKNIKNGEIINYREGDPRYYLFYVENLKKNKNYR